jgi:hypothetical protein
MWVEINICNTKYGALHFLHLSVTSSLLSQNILIITLFSNTLSLYPLGLTPIKTTVTVIVWCNLVSTLLSTRQEDKDSELTPLNIVVSHLKTFGFRPKVIVL